MTPEMSPAGGDPAVPPAGRTHPGPINPKRYVRAIDHANRVLELRDVFARALMHAKLGFDPSGFAWEVIVLGPGSVSYRIVPWCDRGGPDLIDQRLAAIDPNFPVREYDPRGGYRVWLSRLGLEAPLLLTETDTPERAAWAVLTHRTNVTTP